MPRRRAKWIVGVLVALLASAGAVAAVGAWYVAPRLPHYDDIKALAEIARDNARAPKIERIGYVSEERAIAADLHIPPRPEGFMVFAHGNRPEGRKHVLARALASGLGAHYVTLAFDFRGYGESGPLGPYRPGMTLDLTSDIIEGVEYLSRRFGVPARDVILVGHSFGSASVGLAGKKLDSNAVVAIGTGVVEKLIHRPAFIAAAQAKLAQVGLEVPLDSIPPLYKPLFAGKIYDTCPNGLRVFIWGEREYGWRQMGEILDPLRRECPRRIVTLVIPVANHMYFSESRDFAAYLRYALAFDARDWSDAAVGAVLKSLRSR